MAREGQAVQYFAAELVRFEGAERSARARALAAQAEELMGVVVHLLARESPLYCEVLAELRRGKELCEQWADWWDAFQFTPRESCVPEPELFWIAHPPHMRQGQVPTYASRVK